MWSDLAAHAVTHVYLAGSALLLALVAGIPLGIASALLRPLRSPALALAGIGRTLPSLAVLMLLLPMLGVGSAPAIVALALLAAPPILIAVDAGIRAVPAAALDAALGMGMRPSQTFGRVVVPLALPVAFSGVRTAATETIASATLATFVGAGGLGDLIVRGMQTGDTVALISGAATVALLALAVELALGRAAVRIEARA
ncbi:MAG TPA: ABC transporter permease subunit [Candidatus Tumulicola sp.]|jgi:osmoprotectant transport system permease protein